MSEPFIGEIQMFGGNFAPRNYAFCDGTLLPIAQNTALFSLLGTTYGGDGRVTFGLPDLRGRIPVHAGNGPGLTTRRLGESSGAETAALTVNQIPSHVHAQSVETLQAAAPGTAPNTSNPTNASVAGVMTYSNLAADTLNADMEADSIEHPAPGATGGGQPHNNMAPYQTISFIIALQGLFPSRA
jgi:microcystin-dependent protein